MHENTTVFLTRDVEAVLVPAGERVVLQKGAQARITQSLGGSYTVIVNGNMFRLVQQSADALGVEVASATPDANEALRTKEAVELAVGNVLKTCYDPEIPVNIVDLRLVYHCALILLPANNEYRVEVKLTLTAPGCGMGSVMVQEIRDKLLALEEIIEVEAELVFDPPWNRAMMSESAQLQLGLL